MIRVILADDHHLVRQGIRALLEKADDINIVGEAEDGQEAVELVEQLKPDVLIIDIAMPRMNGIQATQRVRALGLATQAVILSMHSRPTLVRQALRNGARGYLLKNSITEELLLAVRAASIMELIQAGVSVPMLMVSAAMCWPNSSTSCSAWTMAGDAPAASSTLAMGFMATKLVMNRSIAPSECTK